MWPNWKQSYYNGNRVGNGKQSWLFSNHMMCYSSNTIVICQWLQFIFYLSMTDMPYFSPFFPLNWSPANSHPSVSSPITYSSYQPKFSMCFLQDTCRHLAASFWTAAYAASQQKGKRYLPSFSYMSSQTPWLASVAVTYTGRDRMLFLPAREHC